VVEGLALAARDCYGEMGSIPNEIRGTGGGARSRSLRRIFGSALDANVRTSSREEAGAAGAAMMATVSLKHYSSMQACVDEWVTPLLGESEAPDAGLVTTYRETYPAYRTARTVLTPAWKALAEREGLHAR